MITHPCYFSIFLELCLLKIKGKGKFLLHICFVKTYQVLCNISKRRGERRPFYSTGAVYTFDNDHFTLACHHLEIQWTNKHALFFFPSAKICIKCRSCKALNSICTFREHGSVRAQKSTTALECLAYEKDVEKGEGRRVLEPRLNLRGSCTPYERV